MCLMSSVALEELCLIKKVTPNKVGIIRVYDFGLFVDTQTESMCYKLGIRNVKILVFKVARRGDISFLGRQRNGTPYSDWPALVAAAGWVSIRILG